MTTKMSSTIFMTLDIFQKQKNVQYLLSFSDLEHSCAARWANTFVCWLAVFHGYRLNLIHLFLGSAFNAISFHFYSPPLVLD